MIKRLLVGFAGFALIAGAAWTLLNVFLPTDFIIARVTSAVKSATGRDIVISGPIKYSLFPSPGLSIGGITLKAPSKMSGKPLLALDSLDVSVQLWPLLRQDVVIESMSLNKPVIELRVDDSGRRSWDFANFEPPSPFRLAQMRMPEGERQSVTDALPNFAAGGLASRQSDQKTAGSGLIDSIALGDVRIVDGTIRYSDTRAGLSREAVNIDAELKLASVDAPLEARGTFGMSGESANFTSKLTSVRQLLDQTPAKLTIKIEARPLSANFDGQVTLAREPQFDGRVTANTTSSRDAAAWMGQPLRPSQGFGALSADARISAGGQNTTLSDATFVLDGATATGDVSITHGEARPLVKATLAISELDFNKYISTGTEGESVPTVSKNSPQSIEDLLTRPGPKVKGYTKRSGWSEEPFDASAFGRFDVQAKLNVGGLRYKDLQAGKSDIRVALEKQILAFTLDDMQLYEGRGNGIVTIDAANQQPTMTANITLDDVSAGPLLKDAADIDWLSGHGKVTIAVNGRGNTERQIIETLNGTANFHMANGAVAGWNADKMIKSLGRGDLSALERNKTDKTEFTNFTASFDIKNGIAQNQDLSINNPLLKITGAGTITMPARQLDYTVRPKLTGKTDNKSSKGLNLSGLEIPVRISGSWDDPDITANLGGIVADPSKAVETVKELGKQLKGKDAGEIVKELFSEGEEGKPSKAQKLLDQFLKR